MEDEKQSHKEHRKSKSGRKADKKEFKKLREGLQLDGEVIFLKVH